MGCSVGRFHSHPSCRPSCCHHHHHQHLNVCSLLYMPGDGCRYECESLNCWMGKTLIVVFSVDVCLRRLGHVWMSKVAIRYSFHTAHTHTLYRPFDIRLAKPLRHVRISNSTIVMYLHELLFAVTAVRHLRDPSLARVKRLLYRHVVFTFHMIEVPGPGHSKQVLWNGRVRSQLRERAFLEGARGSWWLRTTFMGRANESSASTIFAYSTHSKMPTNATWVSSMNE